MNSVKNTLQLAEELEERTSEDYWDYFESHDDEFKDQKDFFWKRRQTRRITKKQGLLFRRHFAGFKTACIK